MSANLTNYLSPHIRGFAICGTFLRAAHLWIQNNLHEPDARVCYINFAVRKTFRKDLLSFFKTNFLQEIYVLLHVREQCFACDVDGIQETIVFISYILSGCFLILCSLKNTSLFAVFTRICIKIYLTNKNCNYNLPNHHFQVLFQCLTVLER